MESRANTDEVKEGQIDVKSEIKDEPEETTSSTDNLEPLLELVPFIKKERLEMCVSKFGFVDSRQQKTEIPLVGDSWDQNNCALNCCGDDGNRLINSTSPEVQNLDKGDSCNSHGSAIANTSSTDTSVHHNCESDNVEENQLASTKRQQKDEEKAPTKETLSKIYSSEHSENTFCKCMECLVKFKEISCVKTDSRGEECPVCHKRVKFLSKHDCSGIRRHTCTACRRAFTTRSHLNFHVRKVHQGIQDNFICALCKRVFHEKYTLRRHIQTHSKEKALAQPQTCEFCQKVLLSKRSYLAHKKQNHSGKQHVCSECSKAYKYKEGLRNHVETVHSMIQNTKCDLCYNRLRTEESLKKHKEKHHPANSLINSTTPEVENLDKGDSCNSHGSAIANTSSTDTRVHHNCESDNVEENQLASTKRQQKDEEKAPTKETLSKIYSSEHSENIFCKCMECLVKFKEISCVKTDSRREKCPVCHNRVKFLCKHDCSRNRRHSCTACRRAFTSRLYLNTHVRKVHEGIQDNFICAVCNRVFHTKSTLCCHIRIHSKEKALEQPKTCEFCQKVLISKKSYLAHKRRNHSGEQYVCSECSKVFTCKKGLKTHIENVHLMIQKIKCDLCYVRLRTEENLKKHKEKHHPANEVNKNKKSFVCEVCGKSYKDKQRMEDHMNSHKGIKPYMCTDCGKGFRTCTNLEQHSRTHSDKRPYVCDLCGKGFRIRNHLRQHMAVHGLVNTSVKRKRKQSKINETENESDLD